MTSCLSDMRTVRPQGLTFRITQLYGLRLWYLRIQPNPAHPADDGLSVRGSWCNSYGEIFLGQIAQGVLKSLAVTASPRTDDHTDQSTAVGMRFAHDAA
jgi:hypothetical protein